MDDHDTRRLTVVPELSDIVTLGVLTFVDLTVLEHDDRLTRPLAEVASRMSGASALDEDVQIVRAMYRRLGLDPTKTRPSSEALLRRIRRGQPLPRINSLVDLCNWCSLEFQLPYGLYDLDRIQGTAELRLGRPGEEYRGIRKDVVHVAGRLTLADQEGAFGNPTSDSARTMVRTKTTRALVVIFAPKAVAVARLMATLDRTSARVVEFSGGRETSRSIAGEAASPDLA